MDLRFTNSPSVSPTWPLLSGVETIIFHASMKDFLVIERTVTELSHMDERKQVEVVEMTIDDLRITIEFRSYGA